MTTHASIELIEAMEGIAPWAHLHQAPTPKDWERTTCGALCVATSVIAAVAGDPGKRKAQDGRGEGIIDCPVCLVRMDEARIKVGGR